MSGHPPDSPRKQKLATNCRKAYCSEGSFANTRFGGRLSESMEPSKTSRLPNLTFARDDQGRVKARETQFVQSHVFLGLVEIRPGTPAK